MHARQRLGSTTATWPASYTGLDLNPAGIEFARKRHDLDGLDFVHGDAENLPFPDQSFDVVLNVEASHLYPHVSRFLAEVARVLAPGGHFLYYGFPRAARSCRVGRGVGQRSAAVGFVPRLGAEVLRGNERNMPRKQDKISHHGGLARFAAGMTDWAFNGALRRGEFTYRLYCFAKD